MDNEQLPAIEELDFERSSVEKLYRTGAGGINPERWERARRDIRFDDVVAELTGHSGVNSISCPFHGRDATPSFFLYRGTNDGWCFGCPPGSQYYDAVRFISKYREVSRVQALQWLEQQWELPRLSDVNTRDDEDELEESLGFWDLSEPYILKVSRDIQESKDPELAEDYIRIYFSGLALERAAKSTESDELYEQESEGLHLKAALFLARVLGKEGLASIIGQRME